MPLADELNALQRIYGTNLSVPNETHVRVIISPPSKQLPIMLTTPFVVEATITDSGNVNAAIVSGPVPPPVMKALNLVIKRKCELDTSITIRAVLRFIENHLPSLLSDIIKLQAEAGAQSKPGTEAALHATDETATTTKDDSDACCDSQTDTEAAPDLGAEDCASLASPSRRRVQFEVDDSEAPCALCTVDAKESPVEYARLVLLAASSHSATHLCANHAQTASWTRAEQLALEEAIRDVFYGPFPHRLTSRTAWADVARRMGARCPQASPVLAEGGAHSMQPTGSKTASDCLARYLLCRTVVQHWAAEAGIGAAAPAAADSLPPAAVLPPVAPGAAREAVGTVPLGHATVDTVPVGAPTAGPGLRVIGKQARDTARYNWQSDLTAFDAAEAGRGPPRRHSLPSQSGESDAGDDRERSRSRSRSVRRDHALSDGEGAASGTDADDVELSAGLVMGAPKFDGVHLQPAHRGEQLLLTPTPHIFGIGSVAASRVRLGLQCHRCGLVAEASLLGAKLSSTTPGKQGARHAEESTAGDGDSAHADADAANNPRACRLWCRKCSNLLGAEFRPTLMHEGFSSLGYVDTTNASVSAVRDASLLIDCLECGHPADVPSFLPPRTWESTCRSCFSRMRLDARGMTVVHADEETAALAGATPDLAGQHRARKKSQFTPGKPLPNNGACKHYKNSHRWLVFTGCCGQSFPCDACHDETADHSCEWARRMICGFCSREQPATRSDPCVACGRYLTRGSGPVPRFWEGGRGQRDRSRLDARDRHKYIGLNKTTAKHHVGAYSASTGGTPVERYRAGVAHKGMRVEVNGRVVTRWHVPQPTGARRDGSAAGAGDGAAEES